MASSFTCGGQSTVLTSGDLIVRLRHGGGKLVQIVRGRQVVFIEGDDKTYLECLRSTQDFLDVCTLIATTHLLVAEPIHPDHTRWPQGAENCVLLTP